MSPRIAMRQKTIPVRGGEGERRRGKCDDAADGIEEQRPKAPFGLAGHAVDVYVGEPFGLEADPAVNALWRIGCIRPWR